MKKKIEMTQDNGGWVGTIADNLYLSIGTGNSCMTFSYVKKDKGGDAIKVAINLPTSAVKDLGYSQGVERVKYIELDLTKSHPALF